MLRPHYKVWNMHMEAITHSMSQTFCTSTGVFKCLHHMCVSWSNLEVFLMLCGEMQTMASPTAWWEVDVHTVWLFSNGWLSMSCKRDSSQSRLAGFEQVLYYKERKKQSNIASPLQRRAKSVVTVFNTGKSRCIICNSKCKAVRGNTPELKEHLSQR